MSVTRYWIPDGLYQSEEDDDGIWVKYEDHLIEVAKLNHIIAALEGQLKAESEELGRYKMGEWFAKNAT